MIVTVPAWYRTFRCIADACTDSCCIGWEIDIDAASLARYREMPGETGEYLRAHINFDAEPAHFILDGERCPFLNEQGLCRLILAGGEDILCEICARHPRFFEWFGDECEIGLGLCCEEACRLWLTVPEPFAFTSYETDEEPDEREFDPALLDALRNVRKRMLCVLEEKALPFDERLGLLTYLAGEVQDTLDMLPPESQAADIAEALDAFEDVCADTESRKKLAEASHFSQELWEELMETMASFEAIHPQWPQMLRTLSCPQDEPTDGTLTDVCARVMGYFLCRYLLKAVYTDDVYGPVMLAVFSARLFAALDAAYGRENGEKRLRERIELLKMYSQELEYDPDNIEALTELLY